MDTPSGPAPSLALDFCGLKFASPIVLLSGCVGFGEEYTRIAGFSNRDAGAIVLKGTTEKPRLGNPPHRVTETPGGMSRAPLDPSSRTLSEAPCRSQSAGGPVLQTAVYLSRRRLQDGSAGAAGTGDAGMLIEREVG